MLSKTGMAVLILLASFVGHPAHAADEPRIHEVYLAVEAGKFAEAQRMMEQVLREHPNSAKAHYVEAELLSKQGVLTEAQTELNRAEQLAPGLPFAKPESVQALRDALATQPPAAAPTPSPTSDDGLPWGWILLGVAVIGLLLMRSRKKAVPSALPDQAHAAQAADSASAMPATSSDGLGSKIASGLVTGAAVGAGMMAVEALAHAFNKDNASGSTSSGSDDTDLGIKDSSSWGDSSSDNSSSSDSGGDW